MAKIEYPGNFDWYVDAQTERVVYTGKVDSHNYDIYISETGKAPQSLGLAKQYDIQYNIVAVSPDRTMVAYIVECNYYGPRNCLQISSLTTGAVIWDYENTISLAAVWLLRWSPNNRYVVMLGTDMSLDPVISVFDLDNGTSQEFFVEYATGNLAVTS
jgi:hypothetical protein